MERRLQQRYARLVTAHLNAVPALAAGIQALPGAGSAFAATQAAWRFFRNRRVTLPKLVEPLRQAGRQALAESSAAQALLVHDWSKLDFHSHRGKRDQTQLSHQYDRGYELATALLVDAATGSPLAPLGLSLKAAQGLYSTEQAEPQPVLPHLEQVLPWMEACGGWGLERPVVHVIDREADAVEYFRLWDAAGHRFLVRVDDRRVQHQGQSRLLSQIAREQEAQGQFHFSQNILYHGKPARQYVAETTVTLTADAYPRGPDGRTQRLPGRPLPLRLVIVQARSATGQVLAQWLLLTNVGPEVSADQIALWYYWRWRIESFHKLLKSAGLELESWQQESALAIAKRLLVGCMACVTVWQLERQTTPAAQACQAFLVRLSGRQMKRSRPVTTPALLAGLHALLVTLEVLADYTPEQLQRFAQLALPAYHSSG